MFYIVLKNIYSFIKSGIIFGLFALGLVTTLLVEMFVYGIYGSINQQDTKNLEEYQTAIISLGNSYTKLEVATSLDQLQELRQDMDMIFTSFQENDRVIMASYTRTPMNHGGRYFSMADFQKGTPLVILSADLYEQYHDCNAYLIGNKSYEILAYSDRAFSEVPFNSLEDNIVLNDVQIIFKHMLNKSDIQILNDQLNRTFPNTYISLPSEPNMELVAQNLYRSFTLICIIFLALLNISFLYQYVLKKRAKSYGIYRMCGCSKSKGIFLNYIEIMIISAGAFIFSFIVYRFLIERFLPSLNPVLTYRLFLLDYFILFILYLLFVTIIFVPISMRFNKKEPINLIKQG